MGASLQNIHFPNNNREASPVTTYKMSEEDMIKLNCNNTQTKERDYILIQTMNKVDYTDKMKKYRNELFSIEESIVNINATKKIYKARIKQLNPPAFDSIVNRLMNSDKNPSKTIEVKLNKELIDRVGQIAKALKMSRSGIIEKLLEESIIQISSRIHNYAQ